MLKVPSTHRFSATRNSSSIKNKAKDSFQKDNEAEELFHAVKNAALSEEQRSIKLLLEQAKVELVEGKTEETSTVLNTDLETTTTRGEITEGPKSALEFKTPEERPDFLGVVKKKAQKFKEILKVIKENSTLTGGEIDEDLTSEEVRELKGGFTSWCYSKNMSICFCREMILFMRF